MQNQYKILVKGIVQNDNKYLIVEKWYDDRILDPYQWEFVDGVAEFGESPDREVLRLIKEKTGLQASINRILYTWGFMTGDTYNLGIAYLCMTADEDVILSEDLNGSLWITRDEFVEYIKNQLVLQDIEKAELW